MGLPIKEFQPTTRGYALIRSQWSILLCNLWVCDVSLSFKSIKKSALASSHFLSASWHYIRLTNWDRFWSMFPLARVLFGVHILDPQPYGILEPDYARVHIHDAHHTAHDAYRCFMYKTSIFGSRVFRIHIVIARFGGPSSHPSTEAGNEWSQRLTFSFSPSIYVSSTPADKYHILVPAFRMNPSPGALILTHTNISLKQGLTSLKAILFVCSRVRDKCIIPGDPAAQTTLSTPVLCESGSKLNQQGTANFGPWFHLPRQPILGLPYL